MARQINRWLGGALLGPWDIPALDHPTLDLFEALAQKLPRIQAGVKRIDDAKAKIRAEFDRYKH